MVVAIPVTEALIAVVDAVVDVVAVAVAVAEGVVDVVGVVEAVAVVGIGEIIRDALGMGMGMEMEMGMGMGMLWISMMGSVSHQISIAARSMGFHMTRHLCL